MINILIEVAGGFIVVGLLSFHTFLMLRGLTTWEAASRERITYLKYLDENYNPFNEGLCKNTFYFLCSFHSRKWEGVYTKHAQINSSVAWHFDYHVFKTKIKKNTAVCSYVSKTVLRWWNWAVSEVWHNTLVGFDFFNNKDLEKSKINVLYIDDLYQLSHNGMF